MSSARIASYHSYDDTLLLVAPRPCDNLSCQQLCVTTYEDNTPKGECLCEAGYKIDPTNNIKCISKYISISVYKRQSRYFF